MLHKLDEISVIIKKQIDIYKNIKDLYNEKRNILIAGDLTLLEKTDNEIIDWMRVVAQYIKNVQQDIRLCNNTKEEFLNYSQEYSEIDQLINYAEQKLNEAQENRYSDDVKRTIEYLNLKDGETTSESDV